MLAPLIDAARRDAKREFWDNVLPGPRWFWVLGLVAFLGYAMLAVSKPVVVAVVPACDAPEVRNSLNSMLSRATVKERTASYMLAGAEETPAPLQPTLGNLHEAGYAKAEYARGCLASVKIGDMERPYGYTIKISRGGKDKYTVAGATPEIVQARYSHVDAEGKFGESAAPAGRAALAKAIRAGVTKLPSLATMSPEMAAAVRRVRRNRPSELDDLDRTREIDDLEPIGDCLEIVTGTRYACNVILLRNEAFLDPLGRDGIGVVKGDFTIERDGASAPWRVSDAFPEEYRAAIKRGWIEGTTGKAPANEATP
jgi:hypothetical protein